MKKYFLLLFFNLFLFVNGQQSAKINKASFITPNELQTKENLSNLSKANKFYKKRVYDEAYKFYHKLYLETDTIKSLNYRLGVSALEEVYVTQALKYLLESSPSVAKDYYLRLGKAYQLNHLYEEAYRNYNNYYNSLNKNKQRRFLTTFAQLRDECRYGLKAINDSLPYFITNMGASVNSYYDEYSPAIIDGSDILYYTTRHPKDAHSKKVNRKKHKERIKRARFSSHANVRAQFDSKLNKGGNVSIAGKNHANNELYLYSGKTRLGKIHSFRIKNGKIRKTRVRGSVDRKTIHVASLSVSSLGDAGFITDKNKHESGYDLFLTDAATHKRISGAYEAKQFINTKFDERSVSFSPDGRTMYFASNGHEGFGGYDIYKSEKQSNGSWSEPVNLGYPINTAADELYYYPTSDSLVSIISSNRYGGYGGLDLYTVIRDIRIPFDIWGDVSDIVSGKPIFSTISVIDRLTNEVMSYSQSDSLSGEYIVGLEDVGEFIIQVEADGYLSAIDEIEMPTERHSQIRKDFLLTRLATPFTFYGNVTNKADDSPLLAEILLKSLENDSVIGRGFTNNEDGSYSVTVGDKYDASMTVSANNFFTKTDSFMVSVFENDEFNIDVQLVRSKIDYVVTGLVKDSKDFSPVLATLAFFEPGADKPFYQTKTDSVSGKYVATLDAQGPYILETNAEGYFFSNMPIVFASDSTLLIRNIDLQKMSAGTKIVIENILFDTGKATLLPQSFGELDRLANLLLENSDIRLEVSGHTDNTGSAAVNKRLSRSRAESVRNYLVNKGVDGMRLQFEGYGYSRPIESNDTPQGRAANRRVEIEVIE